MKQKFSFHLMLNRLSASAAVSCASTRTGDVVKAAPFMSKPRARSSGGKVFAGAEASPKRCKTVLFYSVVLRRRNTVTEGETHWRLCLLCRPRAKAGFPKASVPNPLPSLFAPVSPFPSPDPAPLPSIDPVQPDKVVPIKRQMW